LASAAGGTKIGTYFFVNPKPGRHFDCGIYYVIEKELDEVQRISLLDALIRGD
jgi:hypothetical protein